MFSAPQGSSESACLISQTENVYADTSQNDYSRMHLVVSQISTKYMSKYDSMRTNQENAEKCFRRKLCVIYDGKLHDLRLSNEAFVQCANIIPCHKRCSGN